MNQEEKKEGKRHCSRAVIIGLPMFHVINENNIHHHTIYLELNLPKYFIMHQHLIKIFTHTTKPHNIKRYVLADYMQVYYMYIKPSFVRIYLYEIFIHVYFCIFFNNLLEKVRENSHKIYKYTDDDDYNATMLQEKKQTQTQNRDKSVKS